MKSLNNKEDGAALIGLVFILGLAFTTYVLTTYRPLNIKAERSKQTAQALMEAKAALIGWSVKNDVAPGRLPCPEDTSKIGTEQEGQAASSCTLPAIGRLPFRTLGIGDLRDGNSDRLWYVISEGFRANPPTTYINSQTQAQLTVDGIANSAVAIVFSPGTPLGSQQRTIPTSASPPVITDYLDLTNNNGDNSFISRDLSSNFNDQLLVISHKDLFQPVEKRVLRDVKSCLDNYAQNSGGKYPWAAPVTDITNYTGVPDTTFGRIPTNIVTTGMLFGIPTISDPAMLSSWSSVTGCIFSANTTYWYTNSWRELVFYQLASGYRPQPFIGAACGGTCLSISGSGNPYNGTGTYRAVVAMARGVMGTQNRASKTDASQYLEGINVHSSPSPSLVFETYQPIDQQYANVNDLVLCIDANNNCK